MALAMNTYRGDFDEKLGDWKTQQPTLRKDQIVSEWPTLTDVRMLEWIPMAREKARVVALMKDQVLEQI